jgi:hypothetical protein
MDTIDIIDAAIASNKDSFTAAFNAAIMPRVSDALEVKKVEIASNLLTPEETTDEFSEPEAEVDGSDAGDSASAEQSTDAETAS